MIKTLTKLAVTVFVLTLVNCASKLPINDFFGIQMNDKQLQKFVIDSFSQEEGIRYLSPAGSNQSIFAWAEFTGQEVRIQVHNNTSQPIASNYRSDLFSIFTKDSTEYFLGKAYEKDYPTTSSISANGMTEYILEMPTDFWSSLETTRTNNMLESFWKGDNSIQIIKDDIAIIKIVLGGQTYIYLKPVPQ